MASVSNSNLSKFYNAINEVSTDHKTLKRKSFKDALNNVGLDDEQKEIAEFLYEMDSWEVIFGEGFDFRFNLNGTYLSGGILGDYAGLSVPRQEILSIAQQICDLNLAYLFGGREYNLNKPINEINRVDCSGYTGYIMAKVFGVTYMNGPATWTQRDNYCYEISEAEAIPGDLVFNHLGGIWYLSMVLITILAMVTDSFMKELVNRGIKLESRMYSFLVRILSTTWVL